MQEDRRDAGSLGRGAGHYAGRPGAGEGFGQGFRYLRMLDQGRYSTITERAAAERIERGYLGSLLRLTLLAPDIVSAILDGRQLYQVPEALTQKGDSPTRA